MLGHHFKTDRLYSSRHLGEDATASQIADALGIVTLLGVTSGLAKDISKDIPVIGVISGLAKDIIEDRT